MILLCKATQKQNYVVVWMPFVHDTHRSERENNMRTSFQDFYFNTSVAKLKNIINIQLQYNIVEL